MHPFPPLRSATLTLHQCQSPASIEKQNPTYHQQLPICGSAPRATRVDRGRDRPRWAPRFCVPASELRRSLLPSPGRHACLVRKCSTRILEEGFRLFSSLRTPFHLCFSFKQFWHEAPLKQPFLLRKDSAETVAYNSWSSDSNERGRLSKIL